MLRQLLILTLGMFALGTDSFVMAGVLREIAARFDIGIGVAGQLTTVYAIAYAVLAPTLAALTADVSRKRLIVTGLGVIILADVATALAPSFELALLGRAFSGLGAALFSPAAMGSAVALVPAERRGFALSVVVLGLTSATALGSPIGAVIGGLGDWRWTMGFVAILCAIAAVGVAMALPAIPIPPKVSLAQRLKPLADVRVGLTLATTTLAMAGTFTLYTYFSVVFGAVVSSSLLLGALLAVWGASGTLANVFTGRILDRVGSPKVVRVLLVVLIVDVALMPWTSEALAPAVIAIAVWGAAGWAVLVPQQHRLVAISSSIAPILLGLNTAATYVGVTTAGVLGAASLYWLGADHLGWVSAALYAAAWVLSEVSARREVRGVVSGAAAAAAAT